MLSKRCQFCWKLFLTQRAINQHISASKVCLRDWQNNIVSEDGNPLKRKRTNSPEPSLVDDNNFITPPEPRQESQSPRADADNEDDLRASDHQRYIEPFPGPIGEALRQAKTSFEILQQTQQLEGKPPWEPFANRAEWGLAAWLIKNIGQKSTDEYLQLPIVSRQ